MHVYEHVCGANLGDSYLVDKVVSNFTALADARAWTFSPLSPITWFTDENFWRSTSCVQLPFIYIPPTEPAEFIFFNLLFVG